MAYDNTKPPALNAQGIAGKRVWTFEQADTLTAASALGYVPEAYDLGMRAGDMVFYTDITAPAAPVSALTAVAAADKATGVSFEAGVSLG